MTKLLLCILRWCGGMRLCAYVMSLCALLMILQRVVVLFIIGTSTLPEDGQVMTETCRRYSKF